MYWSFRWGKEYQSSKGCRPFYEKSNRPVPFPTKVLYERRALWVEPVKKVPSLKDIIGRAKVPKRGRDKIIGYSLDVTRDTKPPDLRWPFSGPESKEPTYFCAIITLIARA